ncbi:MAG: prenyltransferase [Desulfobacterota bacterium]|nr:prenyltransferase [Thermodesulfobacteriota bacterium]
MRGTSFFTAWWRLSRIPFLSVGVFPLILGFALARRSGYEAPLGLYLLSIVATVLIMWMTYYLGEWNDLGGDRINRTFNRFSGGSRVLVEGVLPPWISLLFGYLCLGGSILLGLYLRWRYQTGPWTLLLGGVGIFSGFFYSGKPLRFAYRGLGEVLIGFCYGWLPIATGFYLCAGFISDRVFWLSLPIGLTVFNVILINEFPDEEADRHIGKRNLVVRFGKERMGDLYMALSILAGLFFIKMVRISGKGPWLWALIAFPGLLILYNLWMVWKEAYREPKRLESLCRNTLAVNLSMTLILTLLQGL